MSLHVYADGHVTQREHSRSVGVADIEMLAGDTFEDRLAISGGDERNGLRRDAEPQAQNGAEDGPPASELLTGFRVSRAIQPGEFGSSEWFWNHPSRQRVGVGQGEDDCATKGADCSGEVGDVDVNQDPILY